MADHADGGGDNNIFVYTGGQVPQHLRRIITHARIDTSVEEIDERAFINCRKLRCVEMHGGIRKIEKRAFVRCQSLRRIILPGVRIIETEAFYLCSNLKDVEFGNELEIIGKQAFSCCGSLRHLIFYTVSTIELCAFANCEELRSVTLPGEGLESIKGRAFAECPSLRRIAIPLEEGIMLANTAFDDCDELTRVVPVGSIIQTVSSLHLERWRDDMNEEINRINRALPTLNTEGIQTDGIQQWIESVLRRMKHYKTEHYCLMKEALTLLELALWKAKLLDENVEMNNKEDCPKGKKAAKKAKIDIEAARQKRRVMSGADIVIKNVLPFLKLE
jgi:hypothetical protein